MVGWLREPRRTVQHARRWWPLLSVVLALAVFSLSSQIRLGSTSLFDATWVYLPVKKLCSVFRSSGRFAWPLHLMLIAAAISGVTALRSRALARAVLLVALGTQMLEFDLRRAPFLARTARSAPRITAGVSWPDRSITSSWFRCSWP